MLQGLVQKTIKVLSRDFSWYTWYTMENICFFQFAYVQDFQSETVFNVSSFIVKPSFFSSSNSSSIYFLNLSSIDILWEYQYLSLCSVSSVLLTDLEVVLLSGIEQFVRILSRCADENIYSQHIVGCIYCHLPT